MDDPNSNRRRQLIKEIPQSPSPSAEEDTTCASTVASTAQQQSVVTTTTNTTNTAQVTRITDQRMIVRRQVLHLGVASTGALGALVVSVVPIHLLVGLAVVIALWSVLLFQVFQLAVLEYQNAVQGRGLGRFLPESWYDMLVNESFHEMMSGGTWVQEVQHFALYFIPGITEESRNAYIERLNPRHRRALHRPGLGNFLGPDFMRVIVGDQGLAEQQPQRHRVTGTVPRVVPRRLELPAVHEDNASGLGDDDVVEEVAERESESWANEAVGTRTREVAAVRIEADRSLEILNEKEEDEEEAEEEEEEDDDPVINEAVVFDAVFEGAMNYTTWAFGFAASEISSTVTRRATTALRATLGIGAITMGAGLFGVWAGFWSPGDIRTAAQMPRVNYSMLISSTIASGATAGIFMMLGYRPTTAPPPPPGRRPSVANPPSTPKKDAKNGSTA